MKIYIEVTLDSEDYEQISGISLTPFEQNCYLVDLNEGICRLDNLLPYNAEITRSLYYNTKTNKEVEPDKRYGNPDVSIAFEIKTYKEGILVNEELKIY